MLISRARRDAVLGGLIASFMLVVAVSPVWPILLPVAGALAVLAAVIGFADLGWGGRVMTIILASAGVISFVIASALTGSGDWRVLLSVNQEILGMLAAVSFVAAVTPAAAETSSRLTGAPAVWRTATVTHLLAAVINFSAVSLVGDRLAARGGLSRLDGSLISRSFGAAAFWSPFWAAGAVAFSFAPAANQGIVIAYGGLLAVLALAAGTVLLIHRHRGLVAGYVGYPINRTTLGTPLLLAIFVIVAHWRLPDVGLTVIVLWAALAAAVLVALVRGASYMRALVSHVHVGLPRMRGEVALFVAAGVFSVGVGRLIGAVGAVMWVDTFSAYAAWAFVIVAVLVSLIGIHPLVTIGAVAALLPDPIPHPTLFALSAMIAWGAATVAGPITGLNLLLTGRFGAQTHQGIRGNGDYLLIVVTLALPMFLLLEALVPASN